MRSRGFLLVVLGALLSLRLAAVPATADLGEGLVYVRFRELPADLPSNPAGRPPACVVDLRYMPGSRDAAAAFSAWLKFRASLRSPVFVLANRETGAELRGVLREPHFGTGIAVVGIAGPDFNPDVAVRASVESEKAAYDAFEKDTPLTVLLAENPDKVRNDEARLAKLPLPPLEVETPVAPKPPAPAVDATLRRAVHLHRALGALRRN